MGVLRCFALSLVSVMWRKLCTVNPDAIYKKKIKNGPTLFKKKNLHIIDCFIVLFLLLHVY